MNKVPVIFIHKGSEDGYLEYALRQAKKNDNEVYLIGGDQTKKYESIIDKFYMIDDYTSNTCDAFTKVYEPLSTLVGDYELFCFQRWFILYDFMKLNDIKECFYLDSDVLLFTNAKDEAKKFEQFDLTLIHKCCGNSSYIKYEGLRDVCKFIYTTYSEKTKFDYCKIKSHYDVMQDFDMYGGVCDMTLLQYYARYKNPARVGEMMYIIDGSTYDHCIDQQDNNYEMLNGIKNIMIRDGRPYCKQLSTDKQIRFNTLHFQGTSKRLIRTYYERFNSKV
jgi:hypothetical protein